MMVLSTKIAVHYNLPDCAGISNRCIIFMIVKRVYTLGIQIFIFRTVGFFVFVVFNILVVSAKKVKRRGGLTNRQLNTYPSFYLNTILGNKKLDVSKYQGSCSSANSEMSTRMLGFR